MALFKRGTIFHYDFQFLGQRHQGSTYLKNKEKAKLFVSKLRSDLAMGLVGLHRKRVLFEVFMTGQFLPHVRQTAKKPRTRLFYEERTKRLCEYPGFADTLVDAIDELAIQEFKDWRRAQRKRTRGVGTMSPAGINGELRTLRKALGYAYECKLITRMPRVHLIPGERSRTFVLTGEMETAYLAAAPSPLKEAAILMLDLGLRPEEAVSLRKADVTDDAVTVQSGKTANARRSLPQTARTRDAFRFLAEFFPESDWVFPGKGDAHLTRGALDNAHTRLRDGKKPTLAPRHKARSRVVRVPTEMMPADAERVRLRGTFGSESLDAHAIVGDSFTVDDTQASKDRVIADKMPARAQFPREFVLYSCRHTFGSRLAESGAEVWEIKQLMGHASIVTTQKYVHVSSGHLGLAMRRKEALDKLMRGEVQEETSREDSKANI